MTRRPRGFWRRCKALFRFHRPGADLDAADAYRRWSTTYAEESNDLQKLESDLRRRLTAQARDLRTLEVGAGTGRVTRDLLSAGADVFASDLVPEMLLRAPTRSVMSGRTCVARAEALPFRGGTFDLVVCALTLGHVADLSAALGSMAGALRPGGTLVLTGFHPDATQRGWKRTFLYEGEEYSIEQHVHFLSEYRRILQDLECAIEHIEERKWGGSPVLFGLRARKARCPRTQGG